MGATTKLLAPGFSARASDEIAADALPAAAAQHFKVLRLREGESLEILDGAGGIYPCTVGAKAARLRFREPVRKAALFPDLTLCLAPPKGDDLWTAVQQATEVGAARLLFLRSEHAQIARGQNPPLERAQRVSDAACEQCGRAWRLALEEGWHEIQAALARPGVHVVADEALALQEQIGFVDAAPKLEGPIHLYVGPEGGWSEAERRLFDGKAARLALGSLVLRVPTAAAVGLHFLRLVSLHNQR
jgi:16S rRNA (uracil1498-N3)-methyltransferase